MQKSKYCFIFWGVKTQKHPNKSYIRKDLSEIFSVYFVLLWVDYASVVGINVKNLLPKCEQDGL